MVSYYRCEEYKQRGKNKKQKSNTQRSQSIEVGFISTDTSIIRRSYAYYNTITKL